jgi:glycosyltransferase involved in cell wall biosynthesis|tara:strand:+ start:51 stop:896 length:846 start_codon:yes stop_codon:yes gene_type:complete
MLKKIAVIILTYNSDKIIKKTIKAAKKITNEIIILDSYSTDKTLKIAKQLKCKILKKKFINYSLQRNFIIKKCNNKYEWQLHLDADEVVSNKLINEIKEILKVNKRNNTYLIKKYPFFLKKKLRFGGAPNWHRRFFPSKTTLVEETNYDQHFNSKLKSKNLKGIIYDFNIQNLNDWTNSHNKWSNLSVKDTVKRKNKNVVSGNFLGDKIEQKRFFKNFYLSLPSIPRVLFLFIYKYIFLLGFIDGKPGFYYAILNSLWFRMIIDAKKYEQKISKRKYEKIN